MLSSHPPSSSVPQGTAPWMVTQCSPVRQMCRQSGTASPLGSLFPVSPRESSLSAGCRRHGGAGSVDEMSRGEHSGRQMRHNNPVLSFSSVRAAKTTQSRRLFQAFGVPSGRVTQAAIPRTASFPGAPPTTVCKAKKGAVVMAVASPCAMAEGTSSHVVSNRQHAAAARPEYQHPALPCQPKPACRVLSPSIWDVRDSIFTKSLSPTARAAYLMHAFGICKDRRKA